MCVIKSMELEVKLKPVEQVALGTHEPNTMKQLCSYRLMIDQCRQWYTHEQAQ